MCASRFPICSFIAVHSSRSTRFSLAVAVAVLLTVSQARAQGELQIAELGDCELESGAVIENCRVGYRTLGQLDADGSNAVLFPAWFSGTSEQIGSWWVGPDKLVDDSEWFVIAVDPIGNGVSSSPSNSPGQAAGDFPTYTMRDMVKIERRLVTEVLGLSSLHAVIGISMSGLDVFEWLVSYPDFVRKGVPIVGSPRTSGYDLLRWQTELEVLEASQSCRCFDAGRFVALYEALIGYTPAHRNETVTRDNFAEQLERIGERQIDPYDRASQIRAMLAHDVTDRFDGSLEKAAAAVQADLLVVVGDEDFSINPEAAVAFAKLADGQVLKLSSSCGHLSFACESDKVGKVIRLFLRGR
jgi:homoserine O-acetyltransferase